MEWIAFVGEGRSGHTVVSAILDSHPHIRISEEQKYISKWRRENWTRERIIDALLSSGYGKERKLKALPGMLTYEDPLLALGDKCGWDAVNEVRKRDGPIDIFDKFSKHMGMPIKIIHTSRNPLDNISAWLDSPKYIRIWPDEYYRGRMLIKRYSRFYTTAEQIMENQNIFHLRNEELCLSPEKVLSELVAFLGIQINSDWLSMVSSSVYSKPNERSKHRKWDTKLYDMIHWRIMEKYPSLEYYVK